MRLYGFPYLYAPYQVLVHCPCGVALMQHQAVEKSHRPCQSVDALYLISVLIFSQSLTLVEEVVAVAHQFHTLPRACGGLHVVANPCLGVALANHYAVEINKAVGGSCPHLPDAPHLDFLHQLAVVCVDGIQTEHHILYVVLPVRCAVKHLKQRIELRYALSRCVAPVGTKHALRFVDNHNRSVLGYHVDRLAPSEFLLLGEYYPCRSVATTSFLVLVLVHRGVECLHVYYHHVYVAAP